MAQLVFRTAARRAIAEIASYIATTSGSRTVADRFAEQLIGHCEKLARLPASVGRARPELRADYRSSVFGSYIVFFRYGHDDSPQSHVISCTWSTAPATSRPMRSRRRLEDRDDTRGAP